MENKNNELQIQKINKITAVIGIIIAIVALILGIVTCTFKVSGYIPITASYTQFGGDFYTYEYGATRAAANNLYILDGIAKYIQLALGFIMIIIGLVIALVSVKKLLMAIKMPTETNNPTSGSTD